MEPTAPAPHRRHRIRRVAATLIRLALPALAGSVAAAPAGAGIGPGVTPPATPPPVGVTIVAGTPNPSNWNQPVTVVAHQCAYGYGHNPTGTIGFRDLNTDMNLGYSALTPAPNSSDCSVVSMTFALDPGARTILAIYLPQGQYPTTMTQATYVQTIRDHTQTFMDQTPAVVTLGTAAHLTARECSLTSFVRPTGTMSFFALINNVKVTLGTKTLGYSNFLGCNEASIDYKFTAAGWYWVWAT